ncbi:polyphosphate kinase 2 family protein [Aequorivita sp. SDUM287046]|uniref:Polyphosphate kinase 2 family protein n=1 Tax=Aequorivita aurantiaca TaxID=3053356 RepID=A0ABT8DIM7_9FLAO|nr:PPK2 family polyphosphate kinase [Aequorivita aurantiaca]MDN3724659.1 polyphosphate kinase 2 family protein [Aequorivita aurantiaca]
MKKVKIDDFKVTQPIKLDGTKNDWDLNATEDELKDRLKTTRQKLGKLQDTLYAHGKYAVLVCLQGMDTAGKDSLIREVFKSFNARGVVVHSFKTPTALEKKHDFLWRHYIALPERGKFGIFNRTHYENVLVTRVHPQYILGENLPDVNTLDDINTNFWDKRFQQINDFEKTLQENGTIIFKFFLNISKEEQKQRQLRRLDKPNKNWKFSPGDLDERALWEDYRKYYEDAINRTSKPKAPWYVIPSNDKDIARVIVAEILLQELQKYNDIKEPELDDAIKAKISEYRERLKND